MRWCLLLGALCAFVGAVRAACDACLHRQCYQKQSIAENVYDTIPGIYFKENLMYVRMMNDSEFLRRYNLETGEYIDVADDWGTSMFIVDQTTGNVYIRSYSYDKIFKLDSDMKSQGPVLDQWTHGIDYKDKFYTASVEGMYTAENGVAHLVPETRGRDIYNIIVDNNNDIYFQEWYDNKWQIGKIENGGSNITVYLNGNYALTTDKDGHIIFFNEDQGAIYKINYETGGLVEIGAIADYNISHIILDRDDNIIYLDDSHILYRLKPVQKNVQCEIVKRDNTTRHNIVETDLSGTEVTITTFENSHPPNEAADS